MLQMAWVSSSWSWSWLETRCRIETSCRQRALWPSVTHSWATQPRWGRIAAMVRRTLGQNNSLSLSPTHLSHTTNINPFENKVWEIYFYNFYILFIEVCILCLIMFLHTLAQWLECSPMAWETWVQSQVESYQRL